jgi:hypothetical protein
MFQITSHNQPARKGKKKLTANRIATTFGPRNGLFYIMTRCKPKSDPDI